MEGFEQSITVPLNPGSTTEGNNSQEDRFLPGTVLAGRYRVLAPLGQGGMGRVYRAEDLKLGESVALKFGLRFSPKDPHRLRRLRHEVRIARAVTHPNVCRTYDLVDIGGLQFISMEFVDGEDLASLLRRIGRLTDEKALEVAHQICVGLAAAHDHGVVHRDLKPANIMLDSRGTVRITDFGAAVLEDLTDDRNDAIGTPAYMAPEQMAGEAASKRSDIFALGLVLYEIFTGRQAYSRSYTPDSPLPSRPESPTPPTKFAPDMNPTVERVILRCLASDPRHRPASAMEVAAALPGGDPLARALAEKVTPSPEMLAQAGPSGVLRSGVAILCLLATAGLGLGGAWSLQRHSLLAMVSGAKSPAVLTDRAEELVNSLGHATSPIQIVGGFQPDFSCLEYLRNLTRDARLREQARDGPPSPLFFWYRSSPTPMNPGGQAFNTCVGPSIPPRSEPGMTLLTLDPRGSLRSLEVVPLPHPDSTRTQSKPGWSALFSAADLDTAAFKRVRPLFYPRGPFDQRAAWLGVYPAHPEIPLRVEAASLEGRIVYFRLEGPWSHPVVKPSQSGPGLWLTWASILLICGLVLAAILLAWRHHRLNRGDRRGATRSAVAILCIGLASGMLTSDHQRNIEYFLVWTILSTSLLFAVTTWILYLALEPLARKALPESLFSWSRLLSGRFRDPLVGRDVLFGCLVGALMCSLRALLQGFVQLPLSGLESTNWVMEARFPSIGYVMEGLMTGIPGTMGLFMICVLWQILVHRRWLAFVLTLSLWLVWGGSAGSSLGSGLVLALPGLVLMMVLFRCGLLAGLVAFLANDLLSSFPFTWDFSRWYANAGLTGIVVVLAFALSGCRTATAGHLLLKSQVRQEGPAHF